MHKSERIFWTHEELQAMIPKIEDRLDEAEAKAKEEGCTLKPLPSLTEEECKDYLFRLLDAASARTLTLDECYLHGQILAQFEQAVIARCLGKKGRYYVISEDNIMEVMSKHG